MGDLAIREQTMLSVHQSLSKLLSSKMDAMPKDFNDTRFLQNCMTVLQDIDGIEKMEPVSIARTMLKGAFLGLDFFNKECYAIAYNKNTGTKEKPNWVKDLQFQTDYKGEIKLAKKYSLYPIRDIYAKVVKEGDEYEETITDGKQSINFKPKPFNDGAIIGAFAVVYYEDGSMLYDAMSVAEILKTRDDYSKQSSGPSWTKSPGEMYKKTVLRRLCKLIELDFNNQEQKNAFDEGSIFEVEEHQKQSKSKQQKENIKATSPLDIIDIPVTEVTEQQAEIDDLPFK